METIANKFEFDILMRLYSKSLFRYLYRLTNDYHLAEDLLQETFYKVYLRGKRKKVPVFRQGDELRIF
ncbi:sigma factor, partial [Anoxybacillus kestanbolensis]|uniref:sigma factor n=1 Tax=Anoxybacillus kestanbolensis TaxID=227476 RepID=UPI003D1994F9